MEHWTQGVLCTKYVPGIQEEECGHIFLLSKLCQGEKMKWISIRLHRVIFKLGGGGC